MPKAFVYLGMVMGTFFVAAGILLAVRPDLARLGPGFDPYTPILSFLVIIYGAFRIYRSYNELKNKTR